MTLACFIILNYNGYNETEKLVSSICKWDFSKYNFQIIIVDNCSEDKSFEFLRNHFQKIDRVDVIQTERNGGYSYGNNFGASYAIKKYNPHYIIISNPDVEIEQEMVIQLISSFNYDERIAMCAPVMKAIDGSYSIHSQRLPTYYDDFQACSLRYKPKTIIDNNYQTLNPDGNMIITEMVPGSFFVIRADVFSEIGMFDDNVFLYCEERIIGNKLKSKGYLVITRADLFFIHLHAVTIKRTMNTYKSWKILLNSRFTI